MTVPFADTSLTFRPWDKIAVARFYAEHVLTRVPGLRDSVVEGSAAVNAVALQAF